MTPKQSNDSPPFRTFDEARVFARSLGLKNVAGWQDYCKSGELSKDIPSGPGRVYRDQGWAGYGDWLGTGNVANHLKEYRPFNEAREFARSLGLKSSVQWKEYCKGPTKPRDIPAVPRQVYLKNGWRGFADWLGKPEVKPEDLSTAPMTELVRKGIEILYSDMKGIDKYRTLQELVTPSGWDTRVAYPVTFIAAKLGLPHHRVKYQIDKEYLHRYDQQRRRANRTAKRSEGEFELGAESINRPLGFCLSVPVDWRAAGWETNEAAEDYIQEASLNTEGKLIPRKIGYTGVSVEPTTPHSQIDRSLEVIKYQLEQPMTSFELWDRCTAEGFLRGELGERHHRLGGSIKIAGMDAVRHVVFDPQYRDEKWVARTYSVYMCGVSHGWSISMFCEYSGTFEEVEAQHQLQRAVFFYQIAPSFRTIGTEC